MSSGHHLTNTPGPEMLPPVDDQVLRDNPAFAKLYQFLISEVLNPDGTTKKKASAREEGNGKQDLHQARINHAEEHLLQQAIASVSLPEPKSKPSQSRPTDRPESGESLADLLVILPSLFDHDLCIDSEAAMTALSYPPLSELESLLPRLGDLVSANLHASALSIARITHPSTNPSYLHRHISSLPSDLAALKDQLSEARSTLVNKRIQALASLTKLLKSYMETLKLLVRSLESKQGVASRRLELQALDVSQESRQTEIDAKTMLNDISKDMYTPETISALTNYSAHLKDAQLRASERLRGLQAELAEYGVGVDEDGGKEKKMREMARIYHEMESQMEDVKKDLDRLDKCI